MLNRVQKTFLALALVAGLAVTVTPALSQQQPQQGAATDKNWKDRAEYDLYESITKATDNTKKLALLDSWKQKYPESEYKDLRWQLYLTTYQALGQFPKMIETAKEMLAADPKDMQALVAITYFTPQLNNTAPEALDLGEKAARGLLDSQRPATTSETDWKNLQSYAHKTLGWVAMQRKDNEAAEQAFRKSLELNANQGEVSYWLGTVIVAQKKPEKQSEALYHFARAASYEGPGALSPQGRQQIEQYFVKAYTTFHGEDPKGMAELRNVAKANPFPPAGFTIKSAAEIEVEKQNKLLETDPQLALWLSIKNHLTGEGGQQYFESEMKNAAVPKMRGKVISQKPENRPTEVMVGVENATTPEITLKLASPLPTAAEPGTVIEWEGVPTDFSKEPFMLTFNVEDPKKISGWPEPPSPKRRAPARRKK